MQLGPISRRWNRLLRLLTACFALVFAQVAFANGTLTHLSGQVTVQKADASTVAGRAGMQVLPGDTLMTGANGFVRMELTDGGEMVLRPDSQLKIEQYQFDKEKPAEDSFVFNVLKGGFRAVSGLISKRGNRDAYQAVTPTATIGIRGTQFDLRVCQANCGALPSGTYVAVRYGAVATGNAQGSMDFKAGQVGHIPLNQPPVLLPRDPGVGFTPPATIPKLDEKKKKEKESADAKVESDKKADDKKSSDKKADDKKDSDKKADDKKAVETKDKGSSEEVKDSKPQESKPQDAPAQESKQQESKPQESKPQEAQAQDSKPQEAPAQEVKPQESTSPVAIAPSVNDSISSGSSCSIK